MNIENQNYEIEIEQDNPCPFQNKQTCNQYSSGYINDGCMHNDDSLLPLMSTNQTIPEQNQLDYEQELCKQNNISLNDLIFDKLKRIQEGTYKKDEYNIEEIQCRKNIREYQSNYLSNSQSLSYCGQQEQSSQQWKNIDLQFGEKNRQVKPFHYQNDQEKEYRQRRIQTQPITHILVRELNGNLIFDFKSGVYFDQYISPSGKSQFEDDAQRVVSNAMKQIISIENSSKRSEITAKLQLNVKPLDQFSFLAKLLNEKSNTQLSKQISVFLDEYMNNAAHQQRQCMLRAIQRAEECKIDFMELIKERNRLLNELQKKIVEENGHRNSSFYVASHYCADYESLEYNMQEFSYSYPLVALLGFEPSQFATGIQKKGLQMWVSPHTRALLLACMLYELNNLEENGKKMFVTDIEPFYFKTVDQMTISCKGKREKFVLKFEGIMEYIFEGIYDSIQLLTIEVDLFTIKRILGMRKDYILLQQANQFIDDFEYNIQSQIFLEKYYNDEYKQYIKEQQNTQKVNEQKAKDDARVCQYREIIQQKAVVNI